MVQPPIDPESLKLVDGKRVYPGLLLTDRREYPPSLWNILPQDLPDKRDEYGNLMKFVKVNGAETLRSITVGEDAYKEIPGTVTFDGASGKEYAVR